MYYIGNKNNLLCVKRYTNVMMSIMYKLLHLEYTYISQWVQNASISNKNCLLCVITYTYVVTLTMDCKRWKKSLEHFYQLGMKSFISFLNHQRRNWDYNFYVNEPHSEHCSITKSSLAISAKFYYLLKATIN
jgi:hypothetical protein